MTDNTKLVVKIFLAAVSNNYMQSFQGDIIYDYDTIMERLENNGEIEVYIAKSHFDTERRFQFEENTTIEQARTSARERGWGEYIAVLRVENNELMIEIEKGRNPYKEFPIEQITSCVRNSIILK